MVLLIVEGGVEAYDGNGKKSEMSLTKSIRSTKEG